MRDKIKIKIKRLSKNFLDVPLPSYTTDDSSGMDVRAACDNPIVLHSFETKLIPTDFAMEIPSGFEAQIRPRSGLAAKSFVTILNTPGTIDSDYRGEVKIILSNFGKEDFVINSGDRIAQMIISKVEKAELIEVEELNDTHRSSGGFGHSGVK
ncbi:MAG: dUTP diphosphatase [Bacteroidetes bacterium]|nr:dUTP diphosphatase [Bacteroidota bacterium]